VINVMFPVHRVETTPVTLKMGIRFSTLVECDSKSKMAATNGAIFSAIGCSFIPVKGLLKIKLLTKLSHIMLSQKSFQPHQSCF